MCFFVVVPLLYSTFFFFFFNDTATTEIYTLSLHDALPICASQVHDMRPVFGVGQGRVSGHVRFDGVVIRGVIAERILLDRKSTRLNSSHSQISYAVFCLKKKKTYRLIRHAIV